MEGFQNIDLTSPERLQNDEAQTISNEESAYHMQENPTSSSQIPNTDSKNKSKSLGAPQSDEVGSKDIQSTEPSGSSDGTEASGSAAFHDCPICLQPCIHPARLPCGHIFCFLCIKGVAYKNQRCAMCRREIPAEFLDRPQLVNGIEDICKSKCTDDGYQWFYEGRNGWWQYDMRTSQDIEDAHKNGEKSCTILVAGYVYVMDLEAMLQQRQNEPTRCRRVKRDLANVPKKGVAGLRMDSNVERVETTLTTTTNLENVELLLEDSGLVDDASIDSVSSPLGLTSSLASMSRQSHELTMPTLLSPELGRLSAEFSNRLPLNHDTNALPSTTSTNFSRQQNLNHDDSDLSISPSGAGAVSNAGLSDFTSNTTVQSRTPAEEFSRQRTENMENMFDNFQQMSIQTTASTNEEINALQEQRGTRPRNNHRARF